MHGSIYKKAQKQCWQRSSSSSNKWKRKIGQKRRAQVHASC
jgi:hypothetical protein